MKPCSLFLALGWVALAGADVADAAFDPHIVGADSQWVIYANLDALRASTVGKELVVQAEKAQLSPAGVSIHVDVQKLLSTIGAITGYGANLAQRPDQLDGTLVIQGTQDLVKIAKGVLAEATVSTPENVVEVKTLPFEAYAVAAKASDDANAPTAGQRVVIAFPPEPIVLVSKSEAQLLKARDVFLGKRPSLANPAPSPLRTLVGNADGAFLFASSVIPSSDKMFGGDAPQARILQMAHSASLAVGEKGESTFGNLRLVASSSEMAGKLEKILQGLAAMMSLGESNDQALNEFLRSAVVAREDETVTLNLTYSSARLVQMLHSFQDSRSRPIAGVVSRPRNPGVNGKVIATWSVAPSGDSGTPDRSEWAWYAVDRVSLDNGTALTLTGRRNGGSDARFDLVEITPAEGQGASLKFRPQFMRLVGYHMVASDSAESNGGRMIAARGEVSTAQFDFPGADGLYKVRVHYLAEPQGKATFTLSAKSPNPEPGDTPVQPTNDKPAGPDAR